LVKAALSGGGEGVKPRGEGKGLTCQACGDTSEVIDSRLSVDGDSIRRRRRCKACNYRFTTLEARVDDEDTGKGGSDAILARVAKRLTVARLRDLANSLERETAGTQID
jgi:hypothetical protein